MSRTLALQTPNTLDASQGPLLLQIRNGSRSGQVVPFASSKCTIGTSARCTHRVLARGVQPLHCLIIRGAAATVVRNFSTATRLNGQRFDDALLRPGDRLTIGPVEFQVICLQALNRQRVAPAGPSSPTAQTPYIAPHPARGDTLAVGNRPPEPDTSPAEVGDFGQALPALPEAEAEPAKRPTELDARQKALDSQATELARREAALESLLQEAETRHQALEVRQAELNQRQAELDQRQAELDQRLAELDARQATANDQRSRLEQAQAELQIRWADLSNHQAEIDRQQAELEEQWADLKRRQAELDARHASLDARQTALDRLESELQARQDELARWESSLRDRQQRLDDGLAKLHRGQSTPTGHEAAPGDEAESSTPPMGPPLQMAGFEDNSRAGPPMPADQGESGEQGRATEPAMSPFSSFSAKEPQKPANAPVDAETIFQRLGIRPPVDDEAEETVLSGTTIGLASTSNQASAAHAEEESIDSYMARLLERLRQRSGPQAATAERAEAAEKNSLPAFPTIGSSSSTGEEAGADLTASMSDSPGPAAQSASLQSRQPRPMPKSAAPEDWSHLAAMRELANLSARNALDRHGRNMLRRAIRSKLAVVLLALLAGSTLVALWWRLGAGDFAYHAALVCYLVAVVWGIQYAVLTGRLMVSRSGHLGWRFSPKPRSPIEQSAEIVDSTSVPQQSPASPEEAPATEAEPS